MKKSSLIEEFEKFGDHVLRLFWSRVRIKELDLSVSVSEIKTVSERKAETRALRSPVRIPSAAFVKWRAQRIEGRSFWLCRPEAMLGRIDCDFRNRVVVHGYLDKMESPAVVVRIDLLRRLPQRRKNLAGSFRQKMGEIPSGLLAFYYPIISEALVKSVLDKQSGSLLIWYNTRSRAFYSRALLLINNAGDKPPLLWKWYWFK